METSQTDQEPTSKMEDLMGFKIKVAERAGTALKNLFRLDQNLEGGACSRQDCSTFTQGGEELPDCTRRNITYESICIKCQPGAMKPGPLEQIESQTPSIYVGETSRRIFERAGEHWEGYRKRKPDSHIWKHHIVHHEGEGEPEFRFKVLGQHKSSLTRQISEAVQIRRRGKIALNSKGEYDRCKIHRLTIENQEENLTCWKENEGGNNVDGRQGEQQLLENRIRMDREGIMKTGKREITRNQKRGHI